MSGKTIVAVIVLTLIAAAVVYQIKSKMDRNKKIDRAIEAIMAIKRRHHDIIVLALEGGANEEQHTNLLLEKELEVLEAMINAEEKYGIVIDKSDPTEVGPVVVISR